MEVIQQEDNNQIHKHISQEVLINEGEEIIIIIIEGVEEEGMEISIGMNKYNRMEYKRKVDNRTLIIEVTIEVIEEEEVEVIMNKEIIIRRIIIRIKMLIMMKMNMKMSK